MSLNHQTLNYEEKYQHQNKTIVERCDIRKCSREFQIRFADAVERMMQIKQSSSSNLDTNKNKIDNEKNLLENSKNENNKPLLYSSYRSENQDKNCESSVYFEIATIHGDKCDHGRETFPCQHRTYLYHFETALKEADRINGNNDDEMFLPYQNQTDEKLNESELIPNIVLERFCSFPEHFLITLNRGNNNIIKRNICNTYLKQSVLKSLFSVEHQRHASTQYSGLDIASIEVPHNTIHVALGFPMGNVANAALDIMFFLHHCFVDLIYESYLKIETNFLNQFQQFQLLEEEREQKDLFNTALEPFVHRETGLKVYPKDTFDTKYLGYKYDKLILKSDITQKCELKMPTAVARFPNINIMRLGGRTFQVYTFVVPIIEQNQFYLPENVLDQFDMKEFAGMAAVFGRGPGCVNCKTRDNFQIFIELDQALKRLDLDQSEASLKVACIETNSADLSVYPIEETPIPKPIIVGRVFGSSTSSTHIKSEDKNSKNSIQKFVKSSRSNLNNERKFPYNNKKYVEVVQAYLQRYGYMNIVDDDTGNNCCACGEFDTITENGVKYFQRCMSLVDDGKIGPLTQQRMLSPRCGCTSLLNSFSMHDIELSIELAENRELFFWVGAQPGNLPRKELIKEIHKALNIQTQAVDIKFVRVKHRKDADFTITQSLEFMQEKLDVFALDTCGLILARTEFKKSIKLDVSELWKLHSDFNNETKIQEENFNKTRQTNFYNSNFNLEAGYYNRKFSLLPVLVHQIGHLLGLEHSKSTDDIMFPLYNEEAIELSQNDIDFVQKVRFTVASHKNKNKLLQKQKTGNIYDSLIFTTITNTSSNTNFTNSKNLSQANISKSNIQTCDEQNLKTSNIDIDNEHNNDKSKIEESIKDDKDSTLIHPTNIDTSSSNDKNCCCCVL